MLKTDENQTSLSEYAATKTNADILDDTYFDYHGRYDDGNSPADAFEMKGVVIA